MLSYFEIGQSVALVSGRLLERTIVGIRTGQLRASNVAKLLSRLMKSGRQVSEGVPETWVQPWRFAADGHEYVGDAWVIRLGGHVQPVFGSFAAIGDSGARDVVVSVDGDRRRQVD